jgi:hypothetical protein
VSNFESPSQSAAQAPSSTVAKAHPNRGVGTPGAPLLPASHRRSRLESPWAFGVIAASVLAIGGALWWAIVAYYPELSDRASFGNLFGGINTLFAALAFAALTFTLILQQRALDLQRSQLADQQLEVAEQNRRLGVQAFESVLFHLLSFHHDIAKEVHWFEPRALKDLKGREAFRMLADELRGIIINESRKPGERAAIAIVQEGYKEFHEHSRGVLDHYFRNLYHIIKYIDASGIEEPRRYTSLVRAQLSPSELLLLFYNGLSWYGEKFNPLISKYALLEQLPDVELVTSGHKSLYLPTAYE